MTQNEQSKQDKSADLKRKSVYVSKRTGKAKVVTVITIDPELFEKVMSLAPKVYGIQRGALSNAIEDALRLWLYEYARNVKRASNPPSNIRDKYNKVIECIENEKGFVPITVKQTDLEKCIRDALGVKTDRTVREYLHTFYQLGLIKPLTIENPTSPSEWKNNKAIEIVAKRV